MSDQHKSESEIRLAELIWRTFKLRLSLLILSALALLIVWSALQQGNQEAQQIDTKFCTELINTSNEIQTIVSNAVIKSLPGAKVKPLVLDPGVLCSSGARTWIESTRYTDKTMPLDASGGLPTDVVKLLQDERKAFLTYDAKRHAAFHLQIQLSSAYSSGSVEANALAVAEVVPFCVLGALFVYILLTFQDGAYRRQLRSLLVNTPAADADQRLAEGQFFAGPSLAQDSFTSRYLSAPERVVLSAFFVVVAALLVKVTSTVLFNLVHLTDSIFGSYLFKLYAAMFGVAFATIIASRNYGGDPLQNARDLMRKIVHPAIQFAHRVPSLRKLTNRIRKESPLLIRWLPVLLSVVSFVLLLFPWAVDNEGESIWRGVGFILKEHVVSFNHPGFVEYEINPRVFAEMRVHLYIALLFLLVCSINGVLQRLFSAKKYALFTKAQKCLAWFVFFLAGDFLVYLAVLEYESISISSWPMDLNPLQGGPNAVGTSMIYYNPTWEFYVFIVICSLLILFSLFSPRPAQAHRHSLQKSASA